MAEIAEQKSNGLDTVKLIGSALLVVAGIVAYYWFSHANQLLRAVYVVIGLILALLLAWQTSLGRATWGFITGSRTEVRKMVWPTREETVQTTIAVIVVVLITAVLMWLLDIFLFWALHGVTGQGS